MYVRRKEEQGEEKILPWRMYVVVLLSQFTKKISKKSIEIFIAVADKYFISLVVRKIEKNLA
jgi:hypothetical protein